MDTIDIKDHIRITFKARNHVLISEREKRGFSQPEMAQYLDVPVTEYRMAEWLKNVSKNSMIKISMGLDMSIEKVFPNWISKFGTMVNDGKKYFILSDEFVESSVAPISNDGMTNLLLESMRLDIEKALSNLKPREREILKMRCGLDDKEPMTFEDIGAIVQLSQARTRQIYEKSLRKLRSHDGKTNLLKSYLG